MEPRPTLDDRQLATLSALSTCWSVDRVVLIGAAALGCWVDMTWRRTHDLDLVVVADAKDAAKDLEALGFEHSTRVEHRWTSPQGVPLDVVSISQAELATGMLAWPKSGNTMNLLGIDLALKHNVLIPTGPQASIAVATPAALAITKMASWLDRPADRDRDLSDLAHLMSHYLQPDDLRRWSDPNLTTTEFDDQGAHALGLDVAKIGTRAHREVVRTFCSEVRRHGSARASMAKETSSAGREPEETMLARLTLLARGVNTTQSHRTGRGGRR